jgi:mycothiol synthase
MFQRDAVSDQYFPDVNGERLGAFSRDGQLVASAAVNVYKARNIGRAVMVGHVHPDFVNRGIGRFLMQWSDARATSMLAADRLGRTTIEVHTESLTDAADGLYRLHGFELLEASLVMRRDLQDPLPNKSLPSGVSVASWQPELAREFALAYRPAFSDRPGFPEWSASEWIERVTANDLVPAWSLLARIDARPVGYVIGCADLSAEPPGGFIWQVGVIASQRRKGIGSALILESLRQMRADGAPWVELTVHVDNPGAIQAYKRVGFNTVGRRARYMRRGVIAEPA